MMIQKKFDLNSILPNAVSAYIEKIRTSKLYAPKLLINCTEDNIIKKAKKNIKKSQKYINKDSDPIKPDSCCLLCTGYRLKNKKIEYAKCNIKGKHEIPVIVLLTSGANHYKIKVILPIYDLSIKEVYEVDYRLISECTPEAFKEVINMQKKRFNINN